MARNNNVLVPYNAAPIAVNLTAADTTYNGNTAITVKAFTKISRIPWVLLQSRGANSNPGLVRAYIVEAGGAISYLFKDVPFPATSASTTVPQWSRRIWLRGVVIPAGAEIRAQVTVAATAGINFSMIPQELET